MQKIAPEGATAVKGGVGWKILPSKQYFTGPILYIYRAKTNKVVADMLDSALNISIEDMPTPRHNHHSPARLKLPPIEIPTIDGSYHEWLPFNELFEVIVDQAERSEASYSNV